MTYIFFFLLICICYVFFKQQGIRKWKKKIFFTFKNPARNWDLVIKINQKTDSLPEPTKNVCQQRSPGSHWSSVLHSPGQRGERARPLRTCPAQPPHFPWKATEALGGERPTQGDKAGTKSQSPGCQFTCSSHSPPPPVTEVLWNWD